MTLIVIGPSLQRQKQIKQIHQANHTLDEDSVSLSFRIIAYMFSCCLKAGRYTGMLCFFRAC